MKNMSFGRMCILLFCVLMSCNSSEPEKNDVEEPAPANLRLCGSTSSTLSFSWGEEDFMQAWSSCLYSDAACTQEVRRYDFPAGTFVSAPCFVFSGLDAGTTYYAKVARKGAEKWSAAVAGRTDEFSPVAATSSSVGVILAEDFGELQWEGDPVSGAVGFKPSNGGSFSIGPGSFVLAEDSPSILFRECFGALPSSRLKDWVCGMKAYIRPGAIEIGAPGKEKGYLFSPQFSTGYCGGITVDVTVEAASWSDAGQGAWCVAAVSPENVRANAYSSDFRQHPSGSDKIKYFTVSSALKWEKVTVSGLRLDDGDRIMIGPRANFTARNDDGCRLLVGSVSVKATGGMILEDPLRFADGSKLASPSEWPRRREEILDIFQKEMYGQMPPASPVYWEKVEAGNTVLPPLAGYPSADAVREQYRMWFKPDRSGPSIIWLVIRPAAVKGKVPVIMTLNYYGNHYLMNDTEVLGPEFAGNIVSGGRGGWTDPSNRYFFPANLLVSRGYALVTAHYEDITGDPEPFVASRAYNRVFSLWGPRDESRTDNTTALAAWAWGLMRGLDLVGEIDGLDESNVIVTGCSRVGKAALIAAAFDERFKVAVPVQTGSGGVPLSKHLNPDKESVASETSTYPHWFCRAYYKYAGNEPAMPFDQHMLISCIAPRACCVHGFNHKWFDTEGEYLAVKAASPVWTFLGKGGMPDVPWPATGSTSGIGPDLGYVRREGSKAADHGMILQDWLWLLDFADAHVK